MSEGIPVPEALCRAFEDLVMDTKAIEAKHAHFSQAIHDEEKAVASYARELWKETFNVMGLTPGAEYKYNDGKIYPVPRQPNAPDINPNAQPVKLGL